MAINAHLKGLGVYPFPYYTAFLLIFWLNYRYNFNLLSTQTLILNSSFSKNMIYLEKAREAIFLQASRK